MNTPRVVPGEVIVEDVTISDVGIALLILDGQLSETDRYLMTLARRRARLLAELRELDTQIDGVKESRERTEQYIRNAGRAIADGSTFTYSPRRN
jgi:hypothetical protein